MVIRPGRAPIRSSGGAYRAAIAFLRSLGTSAHVWLPGASGVSVASLPSNNYLLSNGSTGYSTVDGVDGLTLDGMGSLGSELISGTTGWYRYDATSTVSIVGGLIRITCDATGANPQLAIKSMTTVVGTTYVFTCSSMTKPATTGQFQLNATNNSDGTGAYANGLAGTSGVAQTISGQVIFKATATTTYIVLRADTNASGVIGQYSEFAIPSVKEYTGTHLTQPTTANKPLVRRGMYNLLANNSDLTTASWAASNATRTSANVATAGGANQFVFQGSVASGATDPYTAAFVVSRLVGTGTISISADSGFSYTAITVTSTPTLFVVAASTGATTRGAALKFAASGDSVQIDGAGLFKGTWTAAQILAEGGIPTTTATAASNPSAGKYWWSFNGSNNSLLSGNLGITNACTIVIAGRVDSLATIQMLFREDTYGAQIYINNAGRIYFSKAGASDLVFSAAGVIVAGVPFVITARLSGGNVVLRLNGVQVATAATALTFSATTGARVGTLFDGVTYPTGGAFGWVVPSAVGLSDADCLTVERLVGSQFPGMAVF